MVWLSVFKVPVQFLVQGWISNPADRGRSFTNLKPHYDRLTAGVGGEPDILEHGYSGRATPETRLLRSRQPHSRTRLLSHQPMVPVIISVGHGVVGGPVRIRQFVVRKRSLAFESETTFIPKRRIRGRPVDRLDTEANLGACYVNRGQQRHYFRI